MAGRIPVYPPHKHLTASKPVSSSEALSRIRIYLETSATTAYLHPDCTFSESGPQASSLSTGGLVLHQLRRVEQGLRGVVLKPELEGLDGFGNGEEKDVLAYAFEDVRGGLQSLDEIQEGDDSRLDALIRAHSRRGPEEEEPRQEVYTDTMANYQEQMGDQNVGIIEGEIGRRDNAVAQGKAARPPTVQIPGNISKKRPREEMERAHMSPNDKEARKRAKKERHKNDVRERESARSKQKEQKEQQRQNEHSQQGALSQIETGTPKSKRRKESQSRSQPQKQDFNTDRPSQATTASQVSQPSQFLETSHPSNATPVPRAVPQGEVSQFDSSSEKTPISRPREKVNHQIVDLETTPEVTPPKPGAARTVNGHFDDVVNGVAEDSEQGKKRKRSKKREEDGKGLVLNGDHGIVDREATQEVIANGVYEQHEEKGAKNDERARRKQQRKHERDEKRRRKEKTA